MHEAPLFAIALPIVFLSEAALLITNSRSTTAFVTICLLLALAVALFVRGALPYYLIHVLPLATLTFAMHLQAWSKRAWYGDRYHCKCGLVCHDLAANDPRTCERWPCGKDDRRSEHGGHPGGD